MEVDLHASLADGTAEGRKGGRLDDEAPSSATIFQPVPLAPGGDRAGDAEPRPDAPMPNDGGEGAGRTRSRIK